MSPVPTATDVATDVADDRNSRRTVPILPYPPMDVLGMLGKEIVVDWQLPSDTVRKG